MDTSEGQGWWFLCRELAGTLGSWGLPSEVASSQRGRMVLARQRSWLSAKGWQGSGLGN